MPDVDSLDFYRQFGPMTTPPAEFAALVTNARNPVETARELVQNLAVHAYWTSRYGVAEQRLAEPQLRTTKAIVARAKELSEGDLALDCSRAASNKVQVTCRDFTVLYVALLRAAGIPARARAGFANYFRLGKWEDHWVVERYDADAQTWVRDDAQIDDFQRTELNLDFDPHHQPAGKFLTGAEAWQAARTGVIDPADCGFGDMNGWAFIAGDMLRDVAALAGVEVLPWDGWGAIAGLSPGDAVDFAWWDELAQLDVSGDTAAIRARYATDPLVRVPNKIQSFVNGKIQEVNLDLGHEVN